MTVHEDAAAALDEPAARGAARSSSARVPGRSAYSLPALDVPEPDLDALLPKGLRRAEPPRLPEVAELDLVRHYVRLSQLNASIDTHFYPLGSCTMKYNPKVHEKVAALPGFAALHPLQEDAGAQGMLELLHRLQGYLASIVGLPYATLQPAAGAQGELLGLLLMRAYHQAQGRQRRTVVIPDSAHGTNPASVAMAGYEVVRVKTNPRGDVDLEDLEKKVSRGDRRADAHEPVHARAVRGADRRHRAPVPPPRRAPVLRRRQPERDRGQVAPGRHGLRHRPLQHPQDVHDARTAAAVRAPGRWRSRRRWSRTCRRRWWHATTTARSCWTTTGRSRSAA